MKESGKITHPVLPRLPCFCFVFIDFPLSTSLKQHLFINISSSTSLVLPHLLQHSQPAFFHMALFRIVYQMPRQCLFDHVRTSANSHELQLAVYNGQHVKYEYRRSRLPTECPASIILFKFIYEHVRHGHNDG